ncbi:hypothetical protein BB934_45535 (plasmid) [Microvirga ossetica]|uniref:Type 4 secretion system PilS N-terminal domain-containing protein n=1 Tax=Microvirga ossetica TaxID=1882682 RepID=A0A1B2EZR5_9HYPH|nr:hypothetical protein [Microvirga ossetica]ANY85485.1 hypothetical protein BB934_45535 [Microvirga ossetica]
MFQLIVAVVSVLLIAVLSVAAFWYGGEVYSEASATRHFIEYTNGAMSIEGGLQLYHDEHGRYPPEIDGALVQKLVEGNYLAAAPEGDWIVDSARVSRTIKDEATCAAINKADGKDTSVVKCPSCLDADYLSWKGCVVPPS